MTPSSQGLESPTIPGRVTFLLWGTLHGLYLVLGKLLHTVSERGRSPQAPSRVGAATRGILTFGLVALTLVFFRAATITDALLAIQSIVSAPPELFWYGPRFHLLNAGAALTVFTVFEIRAYRLDVQDPLAFAASSPRWSTSVLLVLMILLFGVSEGANSVYFQF
jgi:alginate O-acetyltransferase complex protein AlgI